MMAFLGPDGRQKIDSVYVILHYKLWESFYPNVVLMHCLHSSAQFLRLRGFTINLV